MQPRQIVYLFVSFIPMWMAVFIVPRLLSYHPGGSLKVAQHRVTVAGNYMMASVLLSIGLILLLEAVKNRNSPDHVSLKDLVLYVKYRAAKK